MLSRRSVVLTVGLHHLATACHSLSGGCSPLWAAENPSAGGDSEGARSVRVSYDSQRHGSLSGSSPGWGMIPDWVCRCPAVSTGTARWVLGRLW